MIKSLQKICLGISACAVLLLAFGLFKGDNIICQAAALTLSISLAVGIGAVPAVRSYRYTAWIVVAVVAGLTYPQAFMHWGSFDLRNKLLILLIVQMVMFGMGIQMGLRDFTSLATTGKGVLVGLLCHFSIMPLMGFMLTKIFHFEPEIAAGIILIGSCSSGLASNVMVYIARANLVLSVTITAMATLAAPFLTPLLMKLLAGTLIEVKFTAMMVEIIKIVIVPIGAALLHDYLKNATARQKYYVNSIAALCVFWLFALATGLWGSLANRLSPAAVQSMELSCFMAGAFVVGLFYHWMANSFKTLDSLMPYASMFGIVYFTTVTTAAGHDNLMKVGLILFFASVIHNAAGYFFGYWLGRLVGMDKNSSRTIAFEVGLQNGGMASGLAGSMGKLGTVGLAAAVFSPWMNISGSILANYWRRRPVDKADDNIVLYNEKILEEMPPGIN